MSKFQIYNDENAVGNKSGDNGASDRTAFSDVSNQTRVQPSRAAKNNGRGNRRVVEPMTEVKAQTYLPSPATEITSDILCEVGPPRNDGCEVSSPRNDGSDMEIDEPLMAGFCVTEPLTVASCCVTEPRDPRDDALWANNEYQTEMHDYLTDAELRFRPKVNYMARQKDISVQMRTILIDWLVEVGEEYKLHDETLHLAVNYIDRFLSQMAVLRNKLQLVGTACMYIASKYEEIYPPDVGEFVYITDDTYTKKQLLRMEALVCKVLGFELAVPTTEIFTTLFCHQLCVNEKFTTLVRYLTELALLRSDQYLKYTPSQIAASSVYVAYDVLNADPPDNLSAILRHKRSKLIPLSQRLVDSAQEILKPSAQQKAILEKYRADGKHGVPDLFL